MIRHLTLKVCVLLAFHATWWWPSVLSAVQIVRNGRPVAVILVADEYLALFLEPEN